MTGKEFFGKLLSNRQDMPEPWDREDSGAGFAATELEADPTHEEDVDVARASGGDGQSSELPEVRPSVLHSSGVDPHAETPTSSFDDDPPIHPLTSTADYDIVAEENDEPVHQFADRDPHLQEGDADSNEDDDFNAPLNDVSDSETSFSSSSDSDPVVLSPAARQPLNGTNADEEVSVAPSNGEHAEKELAAAPAPSNDNHTEKELPAAPAPSNGKHTENELPAAPSQSNERRAETELPAAPEPSNGRQTERAVLNVPEVPNGRDNGVARPSAPTASDASRNDEDTPVAAYPSSIDKPTDSRSPAASANLEEASADDMQAAAHKPTNGRNTNPDSNAAQTPAKNGQAKLASPPAREPSVVSHPRVQSAQQPQNRTRQDAPAAQKSERKEADPPKARPKPPASVKGDIELRGIKDRVVIRLLDKKLVSEEHVKAALRERNKDNLKATLWRIVAHQNGVNREAIYREAALTYAFVERKLEEKDVDLEFVRQVADVFPEKRRNRLIELRVVPVGYEFEQQTQMLRVVFLTHDPSLPAVRELMQELNLERYELQYAPELVVKDLLSKAFPRKNEYLERMSEDPLAYDLGMSYEEEKGELIDEEALEAEINRSSLINLFEAALVESVHKGASDIHIYPNAKRQVEIHFRIDGRLVLWHLEDKVHPESLLAVIKDNTMNVDRFERDMAQDGFIQRKVDDTLIRYRVSILPIATAQQSLHAESIVIRVLDDRKVITDLSQLGLLKGALERFDMAIRQPHGMVILTGPTGSGKSTTLVAALHQVVNPEINVLTVEDPVEYIIPSVRQIKLNHKLNLEQALRSILRHDPDVVMVGEMRDRPTAELAIKLANTGHLTFSTLHTNDAPSAVSRLYKMGVEPFLIAYAINLIVAQRLIRSLCPTCKVVDNDPDPILLDRLGFTSDDLSATTLYKASGDPTCKTCKGTGYKGRRAISEALYFSRAIRHMVVEADTKIDEDALREAAKKEGMLTLQDSAREVVKMGVTSVDEMMRVTTSEE